MDDLFLQKKFSEHRFPIPLAPVNRFPLPANRNQKIRDLTKRINPANEHHLFLSGDAFSAFSNCRTRFASSGRLLNTASMRFVLMIGRAG